MFFSRLALLFCVCMQPALAAGPGLGVPISNQDLKEWDIDIPLSGRGLPSGRGTAVEGAIVYAKSCQSCHGKNGQSGQADELVGGVGSLASPDAERTVGSFWPYSTTLFDYIRRAMPWDHPGSLTNDQLYSVAAWILAQNAIISPDTPLDKTTLPTVVMPNRNGFFIEPMDQK